MTDEPTQACVFRDGQGNYYLLPPEVLEHYRVPAERQAEVEALVGGGDVAGFYTPITIPIPFGDPPPPRPQPWPHLPEIHGPHWRS